VSKNPAIFPAASEILVIIWISKSGSFYSSFNPEITFSGSSLIESALYDIRSYNILSGFAMIIFLVGVVQSEIFLY
jgi:hypothetical protein